MWCSSELGYRHRMNQVIDKVTMEAVVADAWLATSEFDHAREWLRAPSQVGGSARSRGLGFDSTLSDVLLVLHAVRGWCRLEAPLSMAGRHGPRTSRRNGCASGPAACAGRGRRSFVPR